MVWKKVIALIFGLMIVVGAAPFGRVSAADTGITVMLVSDNEADSTLARYLANITGTMVVTTPWGIYDPNVTASVISYGPDKVIVIGGPDAVVETYLEDLKELSIAVERWWGRNRYETNLAVIGNATAKLGIKFENHVVVAPGNDTAAIELALRKAVKAHGVIIFANDTTDITRIMMKIQIQPKNMTVIRSQVMEKVAERIREKVRNRVSVNITEVEVNITAEMATEAIIISQKRITTAEELLANVSVLKKERWPAAEKMLSLAKTELEKAKWAYSEGNYGKAYGLAIAAKAHAEFVIKMTSSEWQEIVKGDPTMMARLFLHRVEIQLEIMEKTGINVSEIRALVEQLKTAVENGESDIIPGLMERIRQKLLEMYTSGKCKFKERIVFPAHGGSAEP